MKWEPEVAKFCNQNTSQPNTKTRSFTDKRKLTFQGINKKGIMPCDNDNVVYKLYVVGSSWDQTCYG